MSLETPMAIRILPRKLYRKAKAEPAYRFYVLRIAAPGTPAAHCGAVCLAMKPVGEPDAVAPHVRFDERGWETGCCRKARITAPILDSTDSAAACPTQVRPVTGAELSSSARARRSRPTADARRCSGQSPLT